MSNKTPRIDRIEKAAFGNEIEVSKIDAPFTSIVNEQGNPRQIPDLVNNMKTSMGVERIAIDPIKLESKEFGPNGETIYKTNDDRARFVGNFHNISASWGTYIELTASGDNNSYVEITFYGTGLNMLGVGYINRAYEIYADGVLNNTLDLNAIGNDSPIGNRNYNPNSRFSVVKGLTLGLHTVKIKSISASPQAYVQSWSGFEILNESTQLVTNAGKPRLDSRNRELQSQVLSSYNSNFDTSSDVLGTKGGRVLVYQDVDGAIKKRLKVTDTPSASEKVTSGNNGSFDTDILGWTLTNSGAGGIISHSTLYGGSLLIQDNTTTDYVQANDTITGLEIGKQYKIIVNIAQIAFSGSVMGGQVQLISGSAALDTNGFPAYTDVWATKNFNDSFTGDLIFKFVAKETTARLQIHDGYTSANQSDIYISDISIKETGAKVLASTDHSNEEVVRSINFREFGANRGDDFSTLTISASNRAFTLDDGTTTLVGSNVLEFVINDEGVGPAQPNDFLTLTFVGTGLDVTQVNTVAVTSANTITVDGFDVVVNGTDFQVPANHKIKICSGLPYGTHTVKITRTSTDQGFLIRDFIVYGPKKPQLSNTDIELADYNIMADYVANTVAGNGTISNGVLRKMATREFIYSGGWAIPFDLTSLTGFRIQSQQASGDYVEYIFFGTGLDFRFNSLNNNNSENVSVTIDGASDLSGYTTSTYGTGVSFANTTGILDMGATSGTTSGLTISGLPLGLHTIRLLDNSSTRYMRVDAFDIITPIHVNNTKVGSLSMRDLRTAIDVNNNIKNKVDLTKAKAWLLFDQSTNTVLASYNVSAVVQVGTGVHQVYYKKSFKNKNYVILTSSANDTSRYGSLAQEYTANTFRLVNSDYSGSLINAKVTMACFGELENEEDIDLGEL